MFDHSGFLGEMHGNGARWQGIALRVGQLPVQGIHGAGHRNSSHAAARRAKH